MSCALALAGLSGCVSPSYPGRAQIGRDLATRTGEPLGPQKPACELMLPESVVWEDGLSEDEAVACGLWNNPAFQELLADLEITQANVVQAAQVQNPQLTTLFPLGPKQWEFALMVPLDVLWLRPIRVAAAELESHRVARRLVQDGLNVVRDVRVAYIDWLFLSKQAELAEQGAQLRSDIARVAEGRLAAGAVAELDVSAMRLDALFAAADAVRARRDMQLARERLRYVLGIQLAEFPLVPVEPGAIPAMGQDVDLLVEQAVSSRPDLRAIQLAVSAAQQRAELARRDVWQLMGILPDINGRGRKGFEAGPGLQMRVPLFHQNQGEIAQAEADAERLCRQYANRRDMAALEVRQAYTQFVQARIDLAIWQEQVVPQADQAVNTARRALMEDGVSLLLVLETARQQLTAQQRELDATAQVHRAIAELERSVGSRLLNSTEERTSEMEVLPVPPLDTTKETP